jgi:hypothetical protein
MTRDAVHAIVKQVFAEAASRVRQRGAEFTAAAAHLDKAVAFLH